MNYDLKNDEIEQNYTNEAMSDKQACDQRVFLFRVFLFRVFLFLCFPCDQRVFPVINVFFIICNLDSEIVFEI
jgi:hypothetical protein